MTVLDASALLAFLFREPGAAQVEGVLADGLLSAVNLSEVLARFARDGHEMKPIRLALEAAGVRVVDFDSAQATEAARLVPHTRHVGLSLGDRACLGLARLSGMPAMTADRAWSTLNLDVDVLLIR